MNSLMQIKQRRNYNTAGKVSTGSERSSQTYPPERHTNLVRRRGGILSVPGKLKPLGRINGATSATAATQKLTKLLLNVNIERSLGPVKVVIKPDNTVSDLIEAAVEIYVKEKRRPFLKETDPRFFALHYSQFSLKSLKADEKLINLGSRNFFMCSKPCTSVNSSCSEKAITPFPLIKFMEFLL
ncbi:hypothetical protein KPL70_006433 [Citrus sinensis]|uniref:DUF7054 domain-containing protein n=2 Tax=Citrus TaxID=2706 RepID=V4TPR9_CITCL|nr:uncharacterized protein LOC18045819 [Citrus x clementina]XP_006477300.2 uncharacterized protein LOC102611481 [Citrus sinensis]ESR53665.1 hypothetical protein CICLE_v10024333mg [Citrus x clementina]KAH9721518.1 hypothetical protein KPL70_006433 [Citrus sinensis]